jgi:hypothetical protein
VQGKTGQARRVFGRLAAEQPDWRAKLRAEAWRLATERDSWKRCGKLARLGAEITSLAADGQDPKALDALAAAQAELGEFREAAATVRRGIDLARKQGENDLAAEMTARLALYEQGRPYRE